MDPAGSRKAVPSAAFTSSLASAPTPRPATTLMASHVSPIFCNDISSFRFDQLRLLQVYTTLRALCWHCTVMMIKPRIFSLMRPIFIR